MLYRQICSYVKWFCVANGIVALAENIVYICALVKKFRYCPKSVPGDLIDRNFVNKEVGYLCVL